MTARKGIEWNEWSETKVENRIEIETGKQQVAAMHSYFIVGHKSQNQTQDSRQTKDSGKSLALMKLLYFPWKNFTIINLLKIVR